MICLFRKRKDISPKQLDRKITLLEGGKHSLTIAQVAEVRKITLELLAKHHPCDVARLIKRYK